MKKTTLFLLSLIFIGFSAFAQKEIEEAQQAYKDGNYQNALKLYSSYISANASTVDADKPSLYYSAALCAVKSKQYSEATKYFQKSVNVNYRAPSSYVYLYNIYKKQGKTAEANKTLTEAEKKYFNNPQIKKILSQKYLKEANGELKKIQKDLMSTNNQYAEEKISQGTFNAKMASYKKRLQATLGIANKSLKYNPNYASAKKVKTAITSAIQQIDEQDKNPDAKK